MVENSASLLSPFIGSFWMRLVLFFNIFGFDFCAEKRLYAYVNYKNLSLFSYHIWEGNRGKKERKETCRKAKSGYARRTNNDTREAVTKKYHTAQRIGRNRAVGCHRTSPMKNTKEGRYNTGVKYLLHTTINVLS